MKSNLLTTILILSFTSLFAQIEIEVPRCNEEQMKEIQARIIESLKSPNKSSKKESFPQDLYSGKVIVFIANRGFENIENVIRNSKKKEELYSFEKTIFTAKEACKMAGLDVMEYHLVMNGKNHFGDRAFSASIISEELKNEAFEKGANYVLQISGSYLNDDYTVFVLDRNETTIMPATLESLYENKFADPSNYTEGETTDHLGPEVVFGGKYGKPKDLKYSTIYYINAAKLLFSKEKSKGLCRNYYYAFDYVVKENDEKNSAVAKYLPMCEVNTKIVDKDAEVPISDKTYLLKYYSYQSFVEYDYEKPGHPPIYESIDCLYLENTLTKSVYELYSGAKTSNFEKFLKKSLKVIDANP